MDQAFSYASSVGCLSFSVFLCVVGLLLTPLTGEGGEGVGEEPNHTTARKWGSLYSPAEINYSQYLPVILGIGGINQASKSILEYVWGL
jgi:hypothetical protein